LLPIAAVAATTTDSASGLGASSLLIVPIAILALWIGLGYMWNQRYRPKKQKAGVAVASFNNILGRILKFVFKEDNFPSKKIKNPKLAKFLTWRNIYLILAALAIILGMAGNSSSVMVSIILLVVIAARTRKVFVARHSVLMRMFEVAAFELKYPRDANLNPWSWVRVSKWENLTIPGETQVAFPAAYKSEDFKNRENFERHFNGTVTDDNTWLYKWKSSESNVLCSPVTHIPELVKYPGSANRKPNEIPIGVGADGEIVWNINEVPHALVTGTTGGGKMLSILTIIKTAMGMKTIGDLQVGDTVFDPEGNPTKVTHLHPIVTPAKAYELTFNNGEKIIADADHLWETETRVARLSRFNGVKKEDKRSREYWLDADLTASLTTLRDATGPEETISIPDIAALIGKSAESKNLYQIAKEIGVAEEIRPKVKFHYNAQIVKQKQKVAYVNSAEFMSLYNAKSFRPTDKNPVSQNQYDKLRELNNELRDTDTMTVENVCEYLNANKATAKWIVANFNSEIPLKDAVVDLYNKAEKVKLPWPDKIFSINTEYINARQFAALVDVEYDKTAQGVFFAIKNKAKDAHVSVEEVELIVPEKTIERYANPYYVYPKRIFIERLLQHNETPLNDQRDKRIFPAVRTTQEIVDTFLTTGKTSYKNHSIRKTNALVLPEKHLPIAPYALGAWLGDGYSANGNICGLDHQVFERIVELGYAATNKSLETSFENKHEDYRVAVFPELAKELRKNSLLLSHGNSVKMHGSPKHIPADYLTASIEQRRELLRGLLDTDGTVKDNGAVQFATSLPRLRDDVKVLVASLGYIPFISQKNPTYTHNGEKMVGQVAYTITFQADPEDRLFHIDRKNKTHRERFNSNDVHSTADAHYIVDIREVEPVPMRCISVDSPTRLFAVSASMIPTHNSTIQRNLIFHCVQHPNDWRFLGIDVKRVELKPYLKYDPVVVGIATTLEDGVEICRYARDEMMDRYEKMEELGVNHYHQLPDKPFALMLMVDETYMFLAPSGIKTDEGKMEDELKGEASKILGDIARLGRASGVHLVLATQRPDAKVIYGELKQNLAARIAAGRMDSIASNMTLDNDNATRLPGNVKGRGFYQAFGEGEQFQGYFAPQDWVDNWLIEQENKENNADHFENGAVKKEKPKKSLFGKKGNAESIEAAANDDDAPVEKALAPRKKGLLGKIQAYNEAQAASAEGDAPERAIPKESIPAKKAAVKNEKSIIEPKAKPKEPSLLISPAGDSHDSDASLLNSIKDEFEDDDFADPFGNTTSVDFENMEDIDFGDIESSSPAPILTGSSAFDFDDEEFELVAGGDTTPAKNTVPAKTTPAPQQPAPAAERAQRPVSAPSAPTSAPVAKVEIQAPVAPPSAPVRASAVPTKKKGLPSLPPRPKLPGQ
jgi:hypothetical protein